MVTFSEEYILLVQAPHIWIIFTASILKNVMITPDRVKVLVGDTLILNCSGETDPNGRINFTWDFPRRKVSSRFKTGFVNGTVRHLRVCDFCLSPGKSQSQKQGSAKT